MKKLLTLLILTAMTVCCLAACGESTASYATDISVADLSAAADAAIGGENPLTVVPDDYIIGMNQIDISVFADYVVKMQTIGANIDEYGIFKAPDSESVASIEKIAKDYIQMRIDTWNPSYLAEDRPKVDNATVKVMGQYVMYCILADDAKSAAFAAVENKLLGK